MSIQPVSNTSNNSYVSALTNDLQNLQNDVQAYQAAQTSGNQDQVSLSQAAMNKVLAQFQSDIPGLSPATQSATGHHHHHHHHGIKGASGSGNATGNNTFASIATSAAYGNNTQSQNSVSSVNLTA
jgi:hypothetical protein